VSALGGSTIPHNPFHAAQADAIAVGQFLFRRSRVAVTQHIPDGPLAEAVDESPPLALWLKRWTLLLVLFYLDPVYSLRCCSSSNTTRGCGATSRRVHTEDSSEGGPWKVRSRRRRPLRANPDHPSRSEFVRDARSIH
jgi:hypothetical protein